MRGATADALVAALRAALITLDPAALVRSGLPPLPPKRARVRVVAVGKAALAMTRGALEAWGDRIDDALVVTTDDAAAQVDTPSRTSVRVASHPLPDARSEAAAEEALARAAELGASDLLLALVSGGASSLLALPPLGVSLEEKRVVVETLLSSGASIRDVNVVRRHASRIKGGRLALAAAPGRTLTLLLSDVIGGAPHDVGSGPSVPDPTTVADAEAALRAWAPELAGRLPLSRSLAFAAEDEDVATARVRTRARVLADPQALADRVAVELARAGFEVRVDPPDEREAQATARARVDAAASLGPRQAIVIACEPRVALPRDRGAGGRAGYVALAAMRDLPPDTWLLCAASDGVDGSSRAAGAVVCREDRAHTSDATIDAALARFDDAPLHRALGTALDLGPTGTNLADVHVVAKS